ncbi:hypothetical protein ACIRD8_04190 [Streptomyces sp. NPDC102451]|uniref:hypothetical protein n=1 Tax=Streptomyces sp. NPDC102451 TaxID=3366177 RepID=UPI003825E815
MHRRHPAAPTRGVHLTSLIAAMITALTGVLIAVLAYVLNQRGELRRSKRQAHLDRINAQLRDLYGPLLVLIEANERTWDAFRERHLTSREERRRAGGLTEEQNLRWRRWVLTVLVPTARQMRDVVLAHGDLFIEDEIPQVVLDFCAHVSSYEVTVVEWEAGEDGDVLVRHPGEGLVTYIRDAYRSLKAAQAEVLRAQE